MNKKTHRIQVLTERQKAKEKKFSNASLLKKLCMILTLKS
tara:strand:- start:576 stop:695 length:120 start_codon:yes stop_codon:yes gene_type:complete